MLRTMAEGVRISPRTSSAASKDVVTLENPNSASCAEKTSSARRSPLSTTRTFWKSFIGPPYVFCRSATTWIRPFRFVTSPVGNRPTWRRPGSTRNGVSSHPSRSRSAGRAGAPDAEPPVGPDQRLDVTARPAGRAMPGRPAVARRGEERRLAQATRRRRRGRATPRPARAAWAPACTSVIDRTRSAMRASARSGAIQPGTTRCDRLRPVERPSRARDSKTPCASKAASAARAAMPPVASPSGRPAAGSVRMRSPGRTRASARRRPRSRSGRAPNGARGRGGHLGPHEGHDLAPAVGREGAAAARRSATIDRSRLVDAPRQAGAEPEQEAQPQEPRRHEARSSAAGRSGPRMPCVTTARMSAVSTADERSAAFQVTSSMQGVRPAAWAARRREPGLRAVRQARCRPARRDRAAGSARKPARRRTRAVEPDRVRRVSSSPLQPDRPGWSMTAGAERAPARGFAEQARQRVHAGGSHLRSRGRHVTKGAP